MKKCSSCKEIKEFSKFRPRKDSKDGFRGQCIECFSKVVKAYIKSTKDEKRKYDLKYRKDNALHISKTQKKYHENNRKTILQKKKEYRLKNLNKISETNREYRENNKELIANKKKEYAKNNKHIINAISARRRSSKLQATPSWSEIKKIKEVYKNAQKFSKLLGVKMVVDHVIPLQGENVSGLHVWMNLQLLEASINTAKSNQLIKGI